MSTSTSLQIRPATPADFQPVIRVVDGWWGRPMAHLIPRFLFLHFHDTSLVAESDGRMVGFLIGVRSQAHPEQAYIHFVGVDPEQAGQGVGRSLYEAFFALVRRRGCRLVRAITSPTNRPSIEFHQALGFALEPGEAEVNGVPVHPDWDGHGSPRVCFSRRLDLLFLVRHAKPVVDPNTPVAEWQLDPQGRAALERLASLPSLATARRIVASTEPKALLTAEAIRAAQGLPPVEPFADLGELHKAGFVADHDGVMAQLFAAPAVSVLPGWESAAAAGARFRDCLDRLVAETEGDLIVASHGTVISLYLAALLGQERVDTAAWAVIGFPDLAVVDPWGRQMLQPFGAWTE